MAESRAASLPSSSPRLLRRLWLVLTGGSRGCSRGRFFLSLQVACCLMALMYPLMFISYFSALNGCDGLGLRFWLTAALSLLGGLANTLGGVSASLFSSHLSTLFTELGWYQAFPPQPVYRAGSDLLLEVGIPAWSFYVATPLLALAGFVAFGLAWRRLRDAGVSRWHLLAGLWGFGIDALLMVFPDSAQALVQALPFGKWISYLIWHLGGLWLLYLYCKPSMLAPAPSSEDTPAA